MASRADALAPVQLSCQTELQHGLSMSLRADALHPMPLGLCQTNLKHGLSRSAAACVSVRAYLHVSYYGDIRQHFSPLDRHLCITFRAYTCCRPDLQPGHPIPLGPCQTELKHDLRMSSRAATLGPMQLSPCQTELKHGLTLSARAVALALVRLCYCQTELKHGLGMSLGARPLPCQTFDMPRTHQHVGRQPMGSSAFHAA